jgi:hypothetical protein
LNAWAIAELAGERMTSDMFLGACHQYRFLFQVQDAGTYTIRDIKDRTIRMSHFRVLVQFCGNEGSVTSIS